MVKVAALAGGGLVIGLLMPLLLGARFVPEPPPEERASLSSEANEAEEEAPAPEPAAIEPAGAEAEVEAEGTEQRVDPGKPLVLSCRDADGKTVRKCDELDLSGSLEDKLKNLSTCDGAEQASGTLSIGFELDFKAQKLVRMLRGKSTTIAGATATKLYSCAETAFADASLEGITHEQSGYTVFYKAQFFPRSNKPTQGSAPSAEAEASGLATVSWNSAVIREKPDKDSKRLTSILRGTRVTVTGKSENWYRIKYDSAGNEGWVYKDAIGM